MDDKAEVDEQSDHRIVRWISTMRRCGLRIFRPLPTFITVIAGIVTILTWFQINPVVETQSPTETKEDISVTENTNAVAPPSRMLNVEDEVRVQGDQDNELTIGRPNALKSVEHLKEPILIGYSREEIRKRNNVRRMSELEQGQDLSRANGVYGFARSPSLYSALVNPDNHQLISLYRDATYAWVIELHKSLEGDIMILVNVDEGDAARLGQLETDVGEIFGFFESNDKHSVLVAIPLSRVHKWQPRVGTEFAVINID